MFKTLSLAAILSSVIASAPASADSYQRWIDVTNVGDFTIEYVEITHVGQNSWGRDLLGNSRVIPVNRSARVVPNRHQGYCMFDLRARFADGSSTEVHNFNLCEAVEVVVDDWGNYQISY